MIQKIKYLHIEDEPKIVKIVQELLVQQGFEPTVIPVQTEKEYIDALKNQLFDFILSDYELQGFNGLKALKFLRKRNSEIPFIVLSGSIDEKEAVRCMQAGATDYIQKVKMKELGPAIYRAVEQVEILQEATTAKIAFKESKTRYKTLFEAAPDGVVIIDENENIVDCNEAECQMSGYSKEEILLNKPGFYVLDEYVEYMQKRFPRLRNREINGLDLEIEIKNKEGLILPVWCKIRPIFNAADEFNGIIIYSRNITNRKRADKTQRVMLQIASAASKVMDDLQFFKFLKNELNLLIDTTNFFVGLYESDSDTLTFPLMQDEKDYFESVSAEGTISGYVVMYQQSLLLKGKEIEQFINQNELKQVGTLSKCWLGVPLITDNQAIGLLVVQNYENENAYSEQDREIFEFVASQISTAIKRKQVESKVFQLSRSVEQSPVITLITDLEGNIQYVNPKFCQTTGYAIHEVIGKNPRILNSGQTSKLEYKVLWKTIKNGQVWRGRFVNKKKDGTLFWEDASIGPIKNDKGEITHYLALKEDITVRVESEKKMNQLNRLNDILIGTFPSILMVIDKNEKIIRWNLKAKEEFGLSWEEVKDKELFNIGIQWDWQVVDNEINEVKKAKQVSQINDVVFHRKDGSTGFLNIAIAPFFSDEMSIDGYLINAEDITEKRISEGQQAFAQKMESIGQLAAGIAHEINTPAQYVSDNIHFLQDSFDEISKLFLVCDKLINNDNCSEIKDVVLEAKRVSEEIDLEFLKEEIPAAIEQSMDGVNKVSTIVKAMKEFSHPGSKDKVLIDLNKAIENTITVSRNEWKYVAEIETEFDESLHSVECFPDEFNQVILNMIINASHAIAKRFEKKEEGLGKIKIRTMKTETFAEIYISDNGSGMSDNVKQKIFEPFFTTKEVGKGTGQGLAISHDVIVNKHNGTINVESSLGKGTTFIIRLPLMSEKE